MMKYALLHIRRDLKNSLITVLSYVAILCVIASLQQSMQSRQQMLASMADAMIVRGEIVRYIGHSNELLNMREEKSNHLYLEDGSLHTYVQDVMVKIQRTAQDGEGNEYQVIAITGEAADVTLAYSSDGVRYLDGYDASIWSGNEQVCVISPDMEEKIRFNENGEKCIELHFQFSSDVMSSVSFMVAGYADEAKETVYLPYETLYNCCDEAKGITYRVDSVSFTVRKNTLLDELRMAAKGIFLDADSADGTEQDFAMVLQDAQYLEMKHEADKALRIMNLMQPILLICSLGAGAMLVVIQMRRRKREIAVIRSLGTGRLRVMAQSILEYALICLPVTWFTLIVWRELSVMTVLGVWLAFMAGALCTIFRFSMIPLVKQIRELEE